MSAKAKFSAIFDMPEAQYLRLEPGSIGPDSIEKSLDNNGVRVGGEMAMFRQLRQGLTTITPGQ
jgi:hypothetical protein